MKKSLLVVILGPTGVGKTEVTIQLAKKFKTNIISADSRQFYKEIPIGTAQPSPSQLIEVKHFFIANYSVTEAIDAGRYGREARALLENKFKEQTLQFMAGGSGLYIDAVIDGFDNLPDSNSIIREDLQLAFKEKGIQVLQEELALLDPEFYTQIDKENPVRLIRAIEVCRLSGKKYSDLRKGANDELPFDVLKIGLDLPREELYERINRRVELMLADGLEAEVRSVFNYRKLNSLRTVGYKEFFDFFDGVTTREKAIELIKQHSRNYAKRQLTWWRRDKEINWFEPSQISQIENLILSKLEKEILL